MRLKNYMPGAMEILLELKEYTDGIVIKIKPEHEKIMKVLKVGQSVTAHNPLTGKVVAPGDFVMMNAAPMMQLPFESETAGGKKIQTLQANSFSIAAYYLPDADETKYHTEIAPVEKLESSMNVIDNPGIEHSSFLKEQRAADLERNSLNITGLD